jgi:hypothetical protein
MTVSGGDKEQDELEKLLADVQRTIRDNDKFIQHLKEESVESDQGELEEEPGTEETEEYEEL